MHPEESQDSIETLLRALVSKKGTTHSNDHAAEVVPEAIQGASRAETHREVTGVTAPNIADILKVQATRPPRVKPRTYWVAVALVVMGCSWWMGYRYAEVIYRWVTR